MHTTRYKICCISSAEEASLAVAHGASALGLVSQMPSGPGVIDEALIRSIATAAPPAVATVLLTSLVDTREIVDQVRRLGVNTVQIVDDLERGSHQDLRRELPGVSILQVIHVTNKGSVEKAIGLGATVDGILLDSGNQAIPVKVLGGTGQTHDWALSRRIVEEAPVPVFLAGGLGPDNVEDAILQVRPYGVDLCSGVRTDGALDEVKLQAFVSAVRGTDRM